MRTHSPQRLRWIGRCPCCSSTRPHSSPAPGQWGWRPCQERIPEQRDFWPLPACICCICSAAVSHSPPQSHNDKNFVQIVMQCCHTALSASVWEVDFIQQMQKKYMNSKATNFIIKILIMQYNDSGKNAVIWQRTFNSFRTLRFLQLCCLIMTRHYRRNHCNLNYKSEQTLCLKAELT